MLPTIESNPPSKMKIGIVRFEFPRTVKVCRSLIELPLFQLISSDLGIGSCQLFPEFCIAGKKLVALLQFFEDVGKLLSGECFRCRTVGRLGASGRFCRDRRGRQEKSEGEE